MVLASEPHPIGADMLEDTQQSRLTNTARSHPDQLGPDSDNTERKLNLPLAPRGCTPDPDSFKCRRRSASQTRRQSSSSSCDPLTSKKLEPEAPLRPGPRKRYHCLSD